MLHELSIRYASGWDNVLMCSTDPDDMNFCRNIVTNNPDITIVRNDDEKKTAGYAALEIMRKIEFSPGHSIVGYSYLESPSGLRREWYILYRSPKK